ncbi:ATP-dependent DNA helicase [Comamonas composti]|uniref:ATP-dependent DNA helicase n=1 Tax=Comamonas composti TaxID=408558 RepID=UPI00047ED0D4|nr:ATP-dependent DNA helicase [Comamonas composti]
MDSLMAAVDAAFAPEGLLSRTQAQFRPREGQTRMALAVACAIEQGQTLVVQAGTGVGKTYAYLVPALLSGQRILVSTATRALQDQLFARDLPRLVSALGLPLRMARLKGRSAYLCLERLERVLQGRAGPQDPQVLRSVAVVQRWAQATRTGDLGELPQLDERSPVVPLVTSTRDNCLGSECAHWKSCHVNTARAQALEADIVVINHHLMFADLELRESGVDQLLPGAGVVVVDEAHQLNDTGVQFAGQTLTAHQLTGFVRDLLRTAQADARGLADWLVLCAQVEQGVRDLRLAAGQAPAAGRLPWQGVTPQGLQPAPWRQAMLGLGQSLRAALTALAQAQTSAELARLYERGAGLYERLATFARPAAEDSVRWLEPGAQQLRMLESPLTIGRILRDRLMEGGGQQPRAWIFTSATLGDDERLSWFTEPCGLGDARVLSVESPFDYAQQAGLYVPQPFAAAGSAEHSLQVARLVEQAAGRLGGRTLVLTTTLRAMHAITRELRQALGLFAEIDVLEQGDAPKLALIERFEQAGRAGQRGCILVASASFWEGVDLPGDSLQLLVLDKLPFPPPDDPLVEARSRQLEGLGRQAFADYLLPEAAMALRQGAGRLIRSETDQGLLVICDARLQAKAYGRRLRQALPPMRELATREAFDEALEALKNGCCGAD